MTGDMIWFMGATPPKIGAYCWIAFMYAGVFWAVYNCPI